MKKICKFCNKEFEPDDKRQIYCEPLCRGRANKNSEKGKATTQMLEAQRKEQIKNNLNVNIPYWFPIEHELLKAYFNEGLSREEMARRLNELRHSRSENGSYIVRTPHSILFQLLKLNLLSLEEFKKLEDEHQKNVEKYIIQNKKNRVVNLDKIKKMVLTRDNNQCIFCKSKEKLEFAHIIPFSETKINIEKEAITLCHFHHRIFDDKNFDVTMKVYKLMISYYPDYREEYQISSKYCETCKKEHTNIERKREGQNPSPIIEQPNYTSQG